MARFYGWTHKQLLSLSMRQFSMYLKEGGDLKSSEQLMAFEASSIPHMTEEKRNQFFNLYLSGNKPVKVHDKNEEIEDGWDFLRTTAKKGNG